MILEPMAYAFQHKSGEVAFGKKERLQAHLADRLDELRPFPFVFAEVCAFLNLEDKLKQAIQVVEQVLRETDPSLDWGYIGSCLGFGAGNEVTLDLSPGQRVLHAEYGEGVVVSLKPGGYATVFFPAGERSVPRTSLVISLGRTESIIQNVAGNCPK